MGPRKPPTSQRYDIAAAQKRGLAAASYTLPSESSDTASETPQKAAKHSAAAQPAVGYETDEPHHISTGALYDYRGTTANSLVIITWLLMNTASLILLIVALGSSSWIVGVKTWINGNVAVWTRLNIGLFRTCNNCTLAADCPVLGVGCNTYSLVDSDNGAWRAAAIFFIFTIIFQFTTLGCIIVAIKMHVKYINWAKVSLAVSCVWMLLGIVVAPIGYAWLDDPCTVLSARHCGLTCPKTGDIMSFFNVCAPYHVGTASWLSIASAVLLFISAFVAAMLRVINV